MAHARAFLLALTLALLAARPSAAEVFNTARTLNPGAVSLSAAYQAFGGPPASLYLGVGVVKRFDLGVRVGFQPEPAAGVAYWGGDAELGLLQDGPKALALSLALGAHGHRAGGGVVIDATLLASKLFLERLEPYVAVDVDWSLDAVRGTYRAVAGLEVIVVKKRLDLLVEGGLGLGQDTPRYLTGGFCLYI